MKILEYLKPENVIAQWVVYLLAALFVFWLGSLLWSLRRHLHFFKEIKSCQDVRSLRDRITTQNDGTDDRSSLTEARTGRDAFQSFESLNRLQKDSPIVRHLRAIFDAGRTEGQLDVASLIRNTTAEIFRLNSLHRSLLSIFIVMGLLGTLFGLADTMSSLDALLRGTAQLNNATLSQSLQSLLGTLKSAFAPSIWGVSLTVVGVLLFAIYMRAIILPLSGLLERTTLTIWVPQLMPTASQRLQERVRLSRQEMDRAIAAQKEVTEFAEEISSKTGSLRETLGLTDGAFKKMADVAERLNSFSNQFAQGVKGITGFQQDLRSLYQQMAEESRAFQQSVQLNIAGSEEFQKQIQAQLNSHHQQTASMLKALQSYETAYITNRGRIDEGLAGVLDKAQGAYESLSRRNEEITQALDEALGKPLRESLGRDMAAVHKNLAQVSETLQVQLTSLSNKLGQLDQPLNTAARNFSDTFSNFDEATRDWLTKQQLEFARQNDTNQKQLARLEALTQQIPQLGEQIITFGRGVEDFSEMMKKRPGLDGRMATALADAANLLRRQREGEASGNK
jgi:hypothetical protein